MNSNKIFLSIIIVIYILTLTGISNRLREPYLWYDEAGQFYISKGLNHDSDPLDKEKGLVSVIENNANYNLDPGGFSILLHFWTKISNSHIWLRFLSFLFFVGVALTFILLSYIWLKNLGIALLMGFIPLLYPIVLKMGFEVRAYSMETLGAVLCVVALEQLKRKLNIFNLSLWSILFSVFITSRYSLIIVVFAASIYVLYLIYINYKLSLITKFIYAILYALPLFISLSFIYFFALVIQNPNVGQLSYLPYLNNQPQLLLNPFNILYLSMIVFCIFIFFKRDSFPIIVKYQSLLYIMITVNIFFIILSLLGKHPWSPISSRCISMIILFLLCYAALFGELLKPLFDSSGVVKYYLVISVLVFTIYIRKEILFVSQEQNYLYYNLIENTISEHKHIYVDRWESPSLRYLLEYGTLKTKRNDLHKFTFGKFNPHSLYKGNFSSIDIYKSKPKMNDYLDYDLLITPELYAAGSNDKWSLLSGTTYFYVQKKNL